MLKLGVKILNCIVLLVTGLALIGVNVTQLYCCHTTYTHWTVQVVPADDGCPCDEACCRDKDCHEQTRHDFYKITDFSKTESGIELVQASFYLPELSQLLLLYLPEAYEKYVFSKPEFPDIPIPRELLCTFLC